MINETKKRILIIPRAEEKHGSGHLRRSIRLVKEFKTLGIYSEIFIEKTFLAKAKLLAKAEECSENIFLCDTAAQKWSFCIFDYKNTPKDIFFKFNSEIFTIGIDEGGNYRDNFDYLIDTMPNLKNSPPNIFSTGFLNLPYRKKKTIPADFPKKIKALITFGGEDEANLTGQLLDEIKQESILSLSNISVIKGPLFKKRQYPDNVEIIDSPKDLSNMLFNWDLVFTSFGLTCFEALYSKTPVILINPSKYHKKLSKKAGIPEAGVIHPDIKKIKKYLNNFELLNSTIQKYSSIKKHKLSDYIALINPSKINCRGCIEPHNKIIYRNSRYSFFRCHSCGLVNQINIFSNKTSYDENYFFEDYKKQYGKTYLEDFDKIKTMGLNRCKTIKKYKPEGRLLDIGCGYGPFLSAAKDSGFNVYGIDTSINATKWINDNLGFPTKAVAIENFNLKMFENKEFDAITMWFVIEHLKSLPKVLENINKSLKKGGVLAISTPNFSGISRKRNQPSFFDANPVDHYTIWNPASAVKLLKKYGFNVKSIKCTAIHPERFFKPNKFNILPLILKKIIKILIGIMTRRFKLGDTFEIYAVKTHGEYK